MYSIGGIVILGHPVSLVGTTVRFCPAEESRIKLGDTVVFIGLFSFAAGSKNSYNHLDLHSLLGS